MNSTIINAKFKEIYYSVPPQQLQENASAIKSRIEFWNYMTNMSMQNTLAQLIKTA